MLRTGELIYSFGDVHLYENHLTQADEQLRREPTSLPELRLNDKVKDVFCFSYEDIELHNYNSAPHIKAKVAI